MLLLSLGPEVATEVFRHLDEGEVRAWRKAVARMRSVPADAAADGEQDYRERVGESGGLRVDGRCSRARCVNQTARGE